MQAKWINDKEEKTDAVVFPAGDEVIKGLSTFACEELNSICSNKNPFRFHVMNWVQPLSPFKIDRP